MGSYKRFGSFDSFHVSCVGKSFSNFQSHFAATESGDISATLQEVVVPILSNSECRKSGYGSSRITDNMMCAGFKDGEKDSCQVGHFGFNQSQHLKNCIQFDCVRRVILAVRFMSKMKRFIKLLAL